jgi:hypothetical protein
VASATTRNAVTLGSVASALSILLNRLGIPEYRTPPHRVPPQP